MSSQAERERLLWLRAEVDRHDRLYYLEATPEVSDHEYDRLLEELRGIEATHPEWSDPASPTQRVGGAPLEGFETIDHAQPMMSVENTYGEAELAEFERRLQRLLPDEQLRYVAEPKIDGVAVTLRYHHGRLALGATRGDGRRGDDITTNLRTLRAIPLQLSPPEDDAWQLPDVLEVRGEVFMPRKELTRLNTHRVEQGEPLLANPRNATAGTLKLLDSRIVATRRLAFLVHGHGEIQGPGSERIQSQSDLLTACRAFGLPVNQQTAVFADMSGVTTFIHRFETARKDLEFDVDGVVIKVDSFDQCHRLGVTSKAPRWAIAYKYAPDQATTRIETVDVQVGKTGALTPVANLTPVELAGTTVKRASLHNFEEVARKDIRSGDHVIIEKAGEIIPYVVRSLPEKRSGQELPIEPPARCPECDATVESEEGQVVVRCSNRSCAASVKERIRFYATRRAMDIDGLGPKLVDALVDNGLVGNIADLYDLTGQGEALVALERVGEKSATNLLDAIDASKQQGLARLIHALSLPHVGEAVARTLAQSFPNLAALRAADHHDLAAIEGIAEVMAEAIVGWLADEQNQRLLARLEAAGVVMESSCYREPAAPDPGAGPLGGATVVIAGRLSRFTKDKAHAAIRRAGGKPSDAVTRRTTFVVTGARPGSKAEKATELGVETMEEDAFLERLGPCAEPSDEDAPEPPEQTAPASGLDGQTVVVTGSLQRWTRQEVEDMLRAAGAKVSGSVSSRTSLLVCGEKAGSKLTKAQKLGVEVTDEAGLADRLGLD